MIDLAQVTLACVDTLHHSLALRALERSRSQIRFGRTLFLTDALPSGIAAPRDIEIERIEPLRSRDDYSRFVLKRLVDHIATSHVLLVQWDGYVINPAAWQSAFLQCDYIGSRWFWFNDGHDVGNGGFSLRSKTLLTALQDPRVELVEAEDITIARHCRDWLERDYGIAFANGALADRFAFEAAYPIGLPFGFHGLFNFCRVMAQDELAALVPHFTDDIVHAPQLAQLLRNCVAMAAWTPAIVIARRMLALDSGNDEARTLLAQSEAASARGFGVGRNDPCPCGSGKRYKQCHGAIAAPTTAQRDTASPDELVRRGIEAQQRGDLGAAESSYRAALARAPEHPHALHYQGMVEYQRSRPAAALPALLHAVELVPSEPEFHNNLGIVCAALDRLADAIAWHRRAIALKPDHAGAWNNLGLALHAQNDPASAVNAFNEALRHAPSFTEARWNLALALLAEGRFAEGWEAYEARQQIAAFAPSAIPSTPRWDGRDARGMRLLLTTEQGLGDAIQFVRFAASLANRGATVFVQTPSTLTNLFRTIEGIANVVEIGAPLPPHNAWLPLMSLGRHLHIDAASLPGPIPYISTNPHRRAAMG
ncbi:MAG TPA: DUF5672 family protein, partial [Casimicrobiaceae bacterium]|nr:DUF5672 family protein [Casimicrobiaceae bacterium]